MIVAYARTLGVVLEPGVFTTSHPDVVNLVCLTVTEYKPFDEKLDAVLGVLQQVIQAQATAMAQSNVHIYTGEPQVYQERTIQPVALNQSVPKSRHEIITEILVEYPDVNGREIERRTGIPATSANRTLKELKGKLK